MVHLAQVDPAAGAPGGVLVLCIVIVGPISMILHFVLRRFRVVVALSTVAFTLFLLAVWAYFELVRHEHSDFWDFMKMVVLAAVGSLLVSSAAGVPLLLARYSTEKRKRQHASRAQSVFYVTQT
ncbi:MAG TPA: hypothetical protein VNZ64_15375 [Candidatus Acidoferrum sp.]|jgi:hypothetical protein|nr:hypothetical protein [Candidatus Acidoferrum sp.]